MFALAAEQGHAAAQVKLGEMYEAGRGCVQVYALALEQFRLAAQQGRSSAHVSMGSMFEEGLGVAQDYGEAARLYRLAAEQGYLGGQFMLGIMFLNGVGGVQREEAVQLLTLAPAQTSDNDAEYAQIVLEMCLRH
jgi:TPR repeat protein